MGACSSKKGNSLAINAAVLSDQKTSISRIINDTRNITNTKIISNQSFHTIFG